MTIISSDRDIKIVIVFTILSLSFIYGCKTTPEKPVVNRLSSVIDFKEMEFDFGIIANDKIVTHDFIVFNKGNGHLLIHNVRTSCGCTVGSFDSGHIKPGGKGIIKIQFDPTGKQGKIVNIITVESNAKPEMVDLKLICEIY